MANPEHLAILESGVKNWNKWREKNPEVEPDLSEADLTGRNLSNVNFTWVNLTNAILERADLIHANLAKANLTKTHLRGVDFHWANLKETDFSGADLHSGIAIIEVGVVKHIAQKRLKKARLFGASFIDALMVKTNFSNTNLEGAEFTRATLIRANFKGANLTQANFDGSDLVNAELDGVLLTKANFTKAHLTKASLTGAILTKATLTHTKLNEANLTGANLENANCENCNFEKANLTSAKCLLAKFKKASFEGATLTRADFWQTDLSCTNFRQSDLTEANFSASTLKKADFHRATLKDADFAHANLKNARFTSQKPLEEFRVPLSTTQANQITFWDNTGQIIDEPFIELSDRALKSRRNLLMVSVLCIAKCYGIKLDQFTFGQTKIIGMTNSLLNWILLGFLLYFLGYFAILGWDGYKKWKIRLTGTPSSFLKRSVGAHTNSPADNDIEQSTAYSTIESQFDNVINALNAADKTKQDKKIQDALKSLNALHPKLTYYSKRFWQHQRLIVNRFIAEYYFPLLIGIGAAACMAWHLYRYIFLLNDSAISWVTCSASMSMF